MGSRDAGLASGGAASSAASVHPRKPAAAAVIAAGGTGIRIGSPLPKQFLEIAGKPVLLHTLDVVSSLEEVIQIVIALPEEHIPTANEILKGQPVRADVLCVPGGASRQESVLRGVAHVRQDADVILVHDAVRPLCDRETMVRVLDAAWKKGAAVPGLPASETIQRISRRGFVLATPPRGELYAIQTPQAFHAAILRSSLDRAEREGYVGTDESSVVRRAGHRVFVVEGSPYNIKITRPLDLDIAETVISGRLGKEGGMEMAEPRLRVGHGIDYHRFAEGLRLILGGVEIPYEKGLEGHSDADVLSHAVCDALLGAAGLGDIGRHFPDDDPANRGRCSLEFLCAVRAKIKDAGWAIRNVDATLLAQKPKLAPYMPGMRQNIAEALGADIADISVKATTTEGMNAEGRGEGISAQAVALIFRK